MKYVYCKTCHQEVPVEDSTTLREVETWPPCELCGAKNWVLPGEEGKQKPVIFISEDDPSIH